MFYKKAELQVPYGSKYPSKNNQRDDLLYNLGLIRLGL